MITQYDSSQGRNDHNQRQTQHLMSKTGNILVWCFLVVTLSAGYTVSQFIFVCDPDLQWKTWLHWVFCGERLRDLRCVRRRCHIGRCDVPVFKMSSDLGSLAEKQELNCPSRHRGAFVPVLRFGESWIAEWCMSAARRTETDSGWNMDKYSESAFAACLVSFN